MCGIAGLVLDRPGRVDGALVEGFLSGLSHRGPDGHGWLAFNRNGIVRGEDVPQQIEADVVLCCRRLAILDLTSAGDQPMQGADGRHAIVFNGEIYNHVELRAELEQLGRRFVSGCDTEVLLAAYAEWGAAALGRLEGMFAFALLDTDARSLVLARDFVGMKPLYHARWRDGLAFSSEIGPLLELPGVSRRADPERLYRYLRLAISDDGDRTLFADVSQLPAAHSAELSLGRRDGITPTRYWQPNVLERTDLSFEAAAAELRERLHASVSRHLRSDAPLGAALSGGLDSSSLVMAARSVRGDDADLATFSFLAGEPGLDEEVWIDVVSRAARTRQHKLRLGPDDLARDLDGFLRVQQEPVVEPPAYAEYRVFKLAHEAGMKVILTGEGSDEMLAGYEHFAAARLASLVRRRRFIAAARFTRSAGRRRSRGGARAILIQDGLLVPRVVRDPLKRLHRGPLMPPWLNGRWFAERGVQPAPLPTPESRDALREQLVRELTEVKLPRLLRYGDRNSMAFSLEARFPFLTPALTGFLISLPEEYLLGEDGTSKAILRRAMDGIVPPAVLERRDKIGFQPPFQTWMRALGPRIEQILDEAEPSDLPLLPLEQLRADWRTWSGGERQRGLQRLWRCVNVVRWADLFKVSFEDG